MEILAGVEYTEEEKLFNQADLSTFIAQHTLAYDELGDMAHVFFENGYMDKYWENEKATYGYHLTETELYALSKKYHNGEDIRKELAIGLLTHNNEKIVFVFDDGKLSDNTYYYERNMRRALIVNYCENGLKFSFNGLEREISFQEIGQAFIDLALQDWNNITYWCIVDVISDGISGISEDTVKELITTFDNTKKDGWENGEQAKINHIKNALNEILHDEKQTEKAFNCIAKEKYNIEITEKKTESTMRHDNEISKKELFICTSLKSLLLDINKDILDVYYKYQKYEEYVVLEFNNRQTIKVCVTACSLSSIAKAVIKAV